MKKVFLTAALFLVWTSALHAQATRTWVSGVGDDANPCSRTAPCKTFAGAISKTAAGGEIDVLDPGGFGSLTITKSITIDGSGGSLAGVLAAGTNGFVINAATTDTVIIRNVSFAGVNTGLTAIRVLQAGAVHVENVVISGFTNKAITVESASSVSLFVKNTLIRNNRGANSGGILIKPTGANAITAVITNSQIQQNTFGLRVEDRGNVTASGSDFSNNENNGVTAFSASLAAAINLESCTVTNNKTSNGVLASGAAAVVRLSNVDIFNNLTGINNTGGSIVSFLNNRVFQNTTNVSGAVTNTPQI